MNICKVAALQMCSGADKDENFKTAQRLIEQASNSGAQIACLPERFSFYGRRELNEANAEAIDAETSRFLKRLAGKLRINIIGGSILEKVRDSSKYFNTAIVVGSNAEAVCRYRKMHLFDIDVPELVSHKESDDIQAGAEPGFFTLEGIRCGVAICYDLRFPELFRHLVLGGAELIFLPSAFTRNTGKLHWEILVRARAIENQCFVVAADQCGSHPGQPDSFGGSMVVGPGGEVLARIGDEEGVALAEIDLDVLRSARCRHPALKSVRNKLLGRD